MAKDTQVAVVMVPFLAQGHLGQLLHLSRLISSYNIPVHYVSSTTHICQASSRHQGWDLLAHDNIHIHEFPIPAFQCPAPDPNAKIKYPTQLQPAFDASIYLREPVHKLLTSLSASARRVVIIHDHLMSLVVQDFVSLPNAESYIFQSSNAFFFYSFYWYLAGRPSSPDEDMLQQLPSTEGCFTTESMAFWNKQEIHLKNSSGELYNTSRAIEGHYFDLLHELHVHKKQWAIGPFNPVDIFEKPDQQRHECLKWLDNQASDSVIYVSFGTTTSLSDEQILAIAVGLENSGQKFIWVLRDADKGDIFTEDVRKSDLPMGYEDRILEAGQGMIVRDWAPQLEILAHASTGGFMSHCGWNSCLESMSMGVPIATWPMHSDQPRNAVLITKVLKLGIVVKDWTPGNDLVESVHIENAVKELIASKEGDEIRKRAVALRNDMKKSVAEGGVSRLELDSFIEHIRRSN
ncbi:Glycosyltransferase [Heracleum sosnowskyi]|uniref:Glycosyltransferase n=1 Tax=Heracleum sosnowskyi TaxID=360622 RepID=A0AAD8J4F7_9APIA|nr:Glycosyltransferase [Heracleum sosnowskyi]